MSSSYEVLWTGSYECTEYRVLATRAVPRHQHSSDALCMTEYAKLDLLGVKAWNKVCDEELHARMIETALRSLVFKY